jgi:type I restriction enzyme, S subunit
VSKRLKHLLWLQYGSALKSDERKPGGIPVYGSNGQVGEHDEANMMCPAIVIGRKGSHGKVTWAGQGGYCIDTAFFVDGSRVNGNLRYAFYLLQALGLDDLSRDSAVPGLDRFDAHNRRIPDIAVTDQQRIADFLDRETARIDHLIEKKQRLVELLEEQHNSFVTTAATRGLIPSRHDKHSGYRWYPKIPEHWTAVRLKFLCDHVVDCLHDTPSHTDDGEYPSIRTADLSRGELRLDNAKRVSEAEYLRRVQRLEPQAGDIVYSREGERFGLAALIPAEAKLCLGQRMMMFRTNDRVVPRYLMWSLNGDFAFNYVKQSTAGATSPHLNIGDIKNIPVFVPPIEEQRWIVAEIEDRSDRKRSLISLILTTIERLSEFRSVLITAAVTGQIDVDEWQRRETTDRRLDEIEEEMRV